MFHEYCMLTMKKKLQTSRLYMHNPSTTAAATQLLSSTPFDSHRRRNTSPYKPGEHGIHLLPLPLTCCNAATSQARMRRFFRARDEDSSQIQYLTAKCHRLAQERAQLERETLVSREKQKRLQHDLEAMAAHLLQKEQMIVELRSKQGQLLDHLHQQQGMVEFLKHHVGLRAVVGPTAEENMRDAELLAMELDQLRSELLALQSSDGQLVGLVEELYAEAQHRTALVESLQAELHSKSLEVGDLWRHQQKQREQLEQLHSAHQRKLCELQQENSSSVKKLQQTADQFERLCKQQRYWMLCVKRFKDSLTEEREAVVQQVIDLERTVLKPRGCSHCTRQNRCPLQDRGCNCRHRPQSVCGAEADQQGEPWEALCEDTDFTQVRAAVDTEQKPP